MGAWRHCGNTVMRVNPGRASISASPIARGCHISAGRCQRADIRRVGSLHLLRNLGPGCWTRRPCLFGRGDAWATPRSSMRLVHACFKRHAGSSRGNHTGSIIALRCWRTLVVGPSLWLLHLVAPYAAGSASIRGYACRLQSMTSGLALMANRRRAGAPCIVGLGCKPSQGNTGQATFWLRRMQAP